MIGSLSHLIRGAAIEVGQAADHPAGALRPAMTVGGHPSPLRPLPMRVRPRQAETVDSYARRLARANHLRPSYLRAVLCGPPHYAGAIRPERLAALAGRPVWALQHALADPAPPRPPARNRP